MSLGDVQTLVLRAPRGEAVAHLMFQVQRGEGGEALRLLARLLDVPLGPSFAAHAHAGDEPRRPLACGPDAPGADRVQCTLGFTWRGLQALNVPRAYLRLFARLAPAYAQGAPLRGAQLGDSGAGAPSHWEDGFGLHQAHVLLTLHGPEQAVNADGDALVAMAAGKGSATQPDWSRALRCVGQWRGRRLGAPRGQQGEWVHFGYRDGLTDHLVEGVPPVPRAPGLPAAKVHRAGEFLLGHANDSGFNVFGLAQAPAQVRSFFQDGSFGVLRPMRQDVDAFEAAVQRWRTEVWAAQGFDPGVAGIKAKLCGRWPSGEALRPNSTAPVAGDFDVDFSNDQAGTGCPWAAHVRRMRSGGIDGGDAHQRDRPLLRRGMPFGEAAWTGRRTGDPRGMLGLFFCASLEDQFEHLLGQWANRRPLGAPDDSTSKDPLVGAHDDARAAMLLPRAGGQPPLVLTGFAAWTQALGTAYTWHPTADALQRILRQDYVEPDTGGPWM
jgi:hypothetical protein